jgi:sulfite reductase (ferredoxin)
LLTEFIPANQIIPTTEGILRILTALKSQTFKARLKFLLKEIGKDFFGDWKKKALPHTVEIDTTAFEGAIAAPLEVPKSIEDTAALKLEKIKCNSAKTSGLCGHRNQSTIR